MKTYEECPHCDTEVKLKRKFKVQECPNCGKDIMPCSICDRSENRCAECPLEHMENKQRIVDAVIEDLKKSFAVGDYTVLEELLFFVKKKNLIQALPEEDWKMFKVK